MAFFALHLYQMIEIAARLHHCHRPSRLSRDNHAEAKADPEHVQRDHIALGRREKIRVQHAFEKSERVGDVVRAPVLGEEEGGNRGGRGVVHCSDIVLEKVENSECKQEKRRTPERGLFLKGKKYAGEGDAEAGAEEERAQRNGHGGFGVWAWDLALSRRRLGFTIGMTVCMRGFRCPRVATGQAARGGIAVDVGGREV